MRRTDKEWRERVFDELGSDDSLKPTAIEKSLKAEYGEHVEGMPSKTTIARLTVEYFTLPPEERDRYRALHFPESLGTAGLPYEAAGAILELLSEWRDFPAQRPRVGLARAFWLVSMAIPTAPVKVRGHLATVLRAAELLGDTDAQRRARRSVEADLVTIHRDPTRTPRLESLEGINLDSELLEEIYPPPLAEAIKAIGEGWGRGQ